VIFAHFYFLSADLPRAGAFFDAHENVCFDLAPGIEFLYNMSKDADATREFFITYADRIVFGTDICSNHTDPEAITRSGIVTQWLATDEQYRVPPDAHFLLGKPEDGEIIGLALPEDVLEKIYGRNFKRICGKSPRRFDITKAEEECRRIAGIAKDPDEALKAAEMLRGV
jgi:predicted TIM-barrel fold metal-dependent hydrolase